MRRGWAERPALALACLLALAPLAGAQTLAQSRAQPPQAPQILETPAPYERPLLRLAEILGALAWLTQVCGEPAPDRAGGEWRARMAALLETEGASPARRDRLAGAYNRGFRGYEASHRACTPNGRLAVRRFLEEGSRIARDVANQYSG
jgi:uncharacterized protein (TIGR02301 family)